MRLRFCCARRVTTWRAAFDRGRPRTQKKFLIDEFANAEGAISWKGVIFET